MLKLNGDVFNSFCSSSRGVAVLFNNNFELQLHKEKKDDEGNLLALDLSIDNNRITLVNIYGPNSDCPDFYDKVRECFLELDNDFFILCGDFNIALNQTLDTHNYSHVNNPKAREKLLEIMSDLGLIDYYRILNPDKKIFTWRRKTPFKQGRLDYILISENLSNITETVSIKSGYRSDHSVVVYELKFNSFVRGKGLWKFNNNLLHDKIYVEKVKKLIVSVKDQYNNSIDESAFLDILLMEIRGITISYSSYRKRENDKIEKQLISDINELENSTDFDFSLLEEKQATLETLRKEKLRGHFIRSRAKWIDEGEKPTKYFCHLESRNFLNKIIKKVFVSEEKILYKQSEIMEEVKSFYEKLFKNSDSELVDIDIQSVVQPLDIPKLDNITADFLDRDISEREILNVLKGMKNNKSPGSDGFSAEFYKFFCNDLKIYITSAINHIFVHGQLPVSQRLGIISCLPKGDKPRQFLKNWRPITLLNVLYKLISGCISYRIKSTLDLLISNTQTGFIQGRYIGENTRFIYDLMSYTEINNLPGLLMLIDFEKAFDSVSWSFLYKVLHFFGFGNNIIKWVKILNTNFKASILQSPISFYSLCRNLSYTYKTK